MLQTIQKTSVAFHSCALANTHQHADWTQTVSEEQASRETRGNGEMR